MRNSNDNKCICSQPAAAGGGGSGGSGGSGGDGGGDGGDVVAFSKDEEPTRTYSGGRAENPCNDPNQNFESAVNFKQPPSEGNIRILVMFDQKIHVARYNLYSDAATELPSATLPKKWELLGRMTGFQDVVLDVVDLPDTSNQLPTQKGEPYGTLALALWPGRGSPRPLNAKGGADSYGPVA